MSDMSEEPKWSYENDFVQQRHFFIAQGVTFILPFGKCPAFEQILLDAKVGREAKERIAAFERDRTVYVTEAETFESRLAAKDAEIAELQKRLDEFQKRQKILLAAITEYQAQLAVAGEPWREQAAEWLSRQPCIWQEARLYREVCGHRNENLIVPLDPPESEPERLVWRLMLIGSNVRLLLLKPAFSALNDSKDS